MEKAKDSYCQVVIVDNKGVERLAVPCSSKSGAKAFVDFYNSSSKRGPRIAKARAIDLSRLFGYSERQS